MSTYDRTAEQRQYRRFKTTLARALNAKDWYRVIAAADSFDAYYSRPDAPPYPDDWMRWTRAADDARNHLIQAGAISSVGVRL